MDLLNKLLELIGAQNMSTPTMILLGVGLYLVFGGKIDIAALIAKVKGLLPKAAGAASNVVEMDDAAIRLAAAHLIRSHLQVMGAPKESIAAFDTHIAPYVWLDSGSAQ